VFAGGGGWKEELQLVARGGCVAWPNGVEPVPAVPAGVTRKAYDAESSAKAFDRLNALIANQAREPREPFHVELSRRYRLDEAAQALRDVQRHHVGKLAIAIRAA
jgi:hypothetical protein